MAVRDRLGGAARRAWRERETARHDHSHGQGKTEHEVTYNKHPLYTFISDVKAGIISGEGSKQFPPAWWLVSPAGNAITKKT